MPTGGRARPERGKRRGDERQRDGDAADEQRGEHQGMALVAAPHGSAGAQHEQHGQLARVIHQPAGAEQRGTGVEDLEQHGEGQQVERRC